VYHPVELGSLSFSLLELALVASAIGVAWHVVRDHSHGAIAGWLAPKEIWWIWPGAMGLLAVGALAIAFQPDQGHMVEAVRTYRWVIVEGVLAYVLARFALARRGGVRIVLALVVPAAAVSFWALSEVIVLEQGFAADSVLRATGTYLHPNNLALYLVRAFILVCGIVLLSRGSSPNRLLIGVSVVIGLALLATLSRGALLGAIVGLLIIAGFSEKRSVILAVASTAIALPAAFFLFARERFVGGGSSGIGETRLKIWSSSIDMIRDYPVSGIGLDQFLYQHNPRYIDPSVWSERYISHPHNIVLDSWLSLGIGGLLILGLAVGLLFRQLRRQYQERALVAPVLVAATATLSAGLAHGLVDNGYFLPDLAVYTWILIALSLGPVCSTFVDRENVR
jgi:O-antigen ligase